MSQMPSIQRLRDIFLYDPETGVITRSQTVSPNGQKGWPVGSPSGAGYLLARVDNKRFKAHRLAWALYYGTWPEHQIDHINGNRADNRIVNLRDVKPSENMQNIRKARSDREPGSLLGTTYCKRDKVWRSKIGINGKRINLGTFTTAEAAYAAYVQKKREIHPAGTI